MSLVERQSVDAAPINPTVELPRYGTPLPPMTGKYRARNPALVAALRILDLLGEFHPKRQLPLPVNRPLRVLIANWAHLGDVVAMLPLLQFLANHPRIEGIGVLVGSWSRSIVSGLPFIEKIHSLDHFLLNRGTSSLVEKVRQYIAQQGEVMSAIRQSRYDASIDLFSVYPSTHRLMWKAGIPTRIGFSCAGLGTYLTHPFGWSTADEYVLTKQLRLLEPIFGSETPKTLPPTYPAFSPSSLADERLTPDRKYVLMHIGAGDYRSWPLNNWLDLGHALKKRGRDIVFTGAPGPEAKVAAEIAGKLGAQSVAGTLSWNEFVTSVSNAAALVSIDTVTGHLAACFGIPTIILLSGRWGKNFFRPNNANAVTLTYPVGCAPCYRSIGCAAMACVKNISVNDVLAVFDQIARC